MMHLTPVQHPSGPVFHRANIEEVSAFLRFLYRSGCGYVAVNAGVADENASADIRMLFPTKDYPNEINTRQWLYYHPERDDLIETIANCILDLANQYGNVYVLRALSKKKGGLKESDMVSSPVIFVDDAPLDTLIPWTRYIATGTGPGQAYLVCDKPATKDDTKRATVACGGDPSGVNMAKLVRVPGTFNTKSKHGGRFLVHTVSQHTSNRVIALEKFRAVYPAVPMHTTGTHLSSASTARLDGDLFNQERINDYRKRFEGRTELLQTVAGNISHITKIPGKIKPGTVTYDLLTDVSKRYEWKNPSGSWDASRVRCNICLGLINVGYDCDFIYAYLDYSEDPETRAIKGAKNVKDDYARFFIPNKFGNLYTQKQAQQRAYQAHARARADRPQKFTADTFYAWLQTQQQDGIVPHKRKARAALAGISTATLDRLENVLEVTGRIQIEIPHDRSGSTVVLKKGVINIPVHLNEAVSIASPNEVQEVLSGHAEEYAEYGTTTPENASPFIMHKNTSSSCLSSGSSQGLPTDKAQVHSAHAVSTAEQREECVLISRTPTEQHAPERTTALDLLTPTKHAAIEAWLDDLHAWQRERMRERARNGDVAYIALRSPDEFDPEAIAAILLRAMPQTVSDALYVLAPSPREIVMLGAPSPMPLAQAVTTSRAITGGAFAPPVMTTAFTPSATLLRARTIIQRALAARA